MTENVIVALIVAAAAIFIGYRFFGKKNRVGCSCGCSGCNSGGGQIQGGKSGKLVEMNPVGGCPHCASDDKSSVNTVISHK